MAFPKFDEWETPWKEGEFDAEKAAKLIYNLSKDKHSQGERITSLREEVDGLKDERDDLTDERDAALAAKGSKTGEGQGSTPDVDKAVQEALAALGIRPKSTKEQRREAEAANDGSDLQTARLEIALEKGLTKAQAARLVGKTREELEADADAYMEEHGLGGGTTDGDDDEDERSGGSGGQAPPSQRVKVKHASTRRRDSDDPDPEDDLDPGALWDKHRHGSLLPAGDKA